MTFLKKIWRPILAIILIAVLIKKGPFDLDQLKNVLTQPKIMILGAVIFLVQNFIFVMRWKLFVDLIAKLKVSKLGQLHLIGMFFNFFIPGGVGGDIVKALELSKTSSSTRSQALSTVMSDRVFGLYAMITFSTVFMAIEYFHAPADFITKLFIISSLFFTGMTICLLFLPIIFKKISSALNQKDSKILINIEKLISSLNFTFTTFKKPGLQLKSLSYSALSQMMAIYFMYSVVTSLGIAPPSFLIFFSLCCFGFVASALPIMPGGIGVGQYAFYALFANISAELGKATITAITTLQIFTLAIALSGGVIFALSPNSKKTLLDLEESEKETI
jgi:glycosyltransferase 2 family protein